MIAVRDERVFLAGIDADEVGLAFGEIGFGPTVEGDAEHAEGDLAQGPAGVDEGVGEIAIDAVPDFPPFRPHVDGLDDGEFAILGDGHVRIEVVDDFGRMSGRGGGERSRPAGRCAKAPHHRGANSTCGAARSAASLSSK